MQILFVLISIAFCSRNFGGPQSGSSSRGAYPSPPGQNEKGKGKGNKGHGFDRFRNGVENESGFASSGWGQTEFYGFEENNMQRVEKGSFRQQKGKGNRRNFQGIQNDIGNGQQMGGKGKGKGFGKGNGGKGKGNTSKAPRGSPGRSELGSWTSSGPAAAPLLGDVGFTTVSGGKLNAGEDIYGPFEAGFGQEQDFVLRRVGCRDPSKGYISGGIDTHISEKVMGVACGVELPRKENGKWVGLLDECGGHTREYHFHERLACLYDVKNSKGGHSTQIGVGLDTQYLYGKWENTNELPLLDACGGHFGVTPDSNGERVYHYHVQFNAPFTFGCYGPNSDGTLVSVDQCRKLYGGCGDGDNTFLDTGKTKVEYDPWCPCYDADGSNVGTKPLPGLILQSQNRLQLDSDLSHNWPFLSALALFGVVFGFILTFAYKTSQYKLVDMDDHELISMK